MIAAQVEAQDFEFSVDLKGSAFYSDSVHVFNQNPDSVLWNISLWARKQVSSELDTLLFIENVKGLVYLSKISVIARLESQDTLGLQFKMTIAVDNRLMKYIVTDIHHYDLQEMKKCSNLASLRGTCYFEGKPDEWNRFRKDADLRIMRMLSSIEEYLTSK